MRVFDIHSPPPPWVKLTTRASSCNTRLHTKFYFAKTHQLCMELIINILVTIIVTRSSFFFLSRLLPSIILTQLSTGHILPSKLCSRTTHWIEEDRWPVPSPSAIHKKKKKNGFRKSENMMKKTVCVIQPIIHRYMTNRVPLYKCRSNIGSRFSPISWTHKNDICPCASQPPPLPLRLWQRLWKGRHASLLTDKVHENKHFPPASDWKAINNYL